LRDDFTIVYYATKFINGTLGMSGARDTLRPARDALEYITYSEIFLINNCQCQNEVKKPFCTTLKFGHMDQLYNNLTPNHG
jgi:hypothetical protein